MSTTSCVFISTCIAPDKQFLKMKYAFNPETLIYVGTMQNTDVDYILCFY